MVKSGVRLVLVGVAVGVLVASLTLLLPRRVSGPILGGSAACEKVATSLEHLATANGSWTKTPTATRARYWNLRTELLHDCPLSGVAYFSTHELRTYLRG